MDSQLSDKIVGLLAATQLIEAEEILNQFPLESCDFNTAYLWMILKSHQQKYQEAYNLVTALQTHQPENVNLRFYRARLSIALGKWQEGLAFFDSIRGSGHFGGELVTKKKPLWSGESLWGKTLLIACEGGLGDIICFSRFAPYFETLGAKVILAAPEEIFPLLRSLRGVSALVEIKGVDQVDFDFWLPSLSCPRVLNLPLSEIDGSPFLQVLNPFVESWKSLTSSSKKKVALAWQGNTKFAEDYLRSVPADVIKGLLDSSDQFEFFTVYPEHSHNGLKDSRLKNLSSYIRGPEDLAGFLMNMDLVISVDSGPAHLAGALGVPVLLLNRVMGWFTFSCEPDTTQPQISSWYNSMRILHQTQWGQWQETITRSLQFLKNEEWPKDQRIKSDAIYHPNNISSTGGVIDLVQTRQGPFLTVVTDFFVGRALKEYGEYSQAEVILFSELIKPGMVVVEAGAHLGAHSVAFGNLVGPKGKVICYEPQEFLWTINRQNCFLQNLTQVEVRKEGLAQKNSSRKIETPEYSRLGNFGALELKLDQSSEDPHQTIQMVTLDSLELDRLDFMKLDIEGMELEALFGAEKTIRRLKPVLYVENDRTDIAPDLENLLRSWGYILYQHFPPLFNTDNFNKNSLNIYPGIITKNILALPQAWADEMLRKFDLKKI
ncbi:FkbM family methyltransferase [Bdellovibrio svalbardensis]|uniref:FkbM family methyltransferase n=1 Tax=Bdellovibrio svalbardensis TaxID=2972972 RepID=A0ABT6DL96_9BACT|nr:FkbM family methyltransferase [Bdellovibrio svalbardensis]MDG0815898.1 FkbM family methyltransferase [Bdellovibrio svalbardensis]